MCGTRLIAGRTKRVSVPGMKPQRHSPGDGAAAAHRRELDQEPRTRNERSARVGRLFYDLRRRNERRARLAEQRRRYL